MSTSQIKLQSQERQLLTKQVLSKKQDLRNLTNKKVQELFSVIFSTTFKIDTNSSPDQYVANDVYAGEIISQYDITTMLLIN